MSDGLWVISERFARTDDSDDAIIGLGYVGLPLARLLATKYSVVGFDIDEERVGELMTGVDSTLEVENDVLQLSLIHI